MSCFCQLSRRRRSRRALEVPCRSSCASGRCRRKNSKAVRSTMPWPWSPGNPTAMRWCYTTANSRQTWRLPSSPTSTMALIVYFQKMSPMRLFMHKPPSHWCRLRWTEEWPPCSCLVKQAMVWWCSGPCFLFSRSVVTCLGRLQASPFSWSDNRQDRTSRLQVLKCFNMFELWRQWQDLYHDRHRGLCSTRLICQPNRDWRRRGFPVAAVLRAPGKSMLWSLSSSEKNSNSLARGYHSTGWFSQFEGFF